MSFYGQETTMETQTQYLWTPVHTGSAGERAGLQGGSNGPGSQDPLTAKVFVADRMRKQGDHCCQLSIQQRTDQAPMNTCNSMVTQILLN